MESSLKDIFHISTFGKSKKSRFVDTTGHQKCGTHVHSVVFKWWLLDISWKYENLENEMLEKPEV